jgi:hypothetical protein
MEEEYEVAGIPSARPRTVDSLEMSLAEAVGAAAREPP